MTNKKGGRIIFTNLGGSIKTVFATTKLDTVFEVEYTNNDAIATFNQN